MCTVQKRSGSVVECLTQDQGVVGSSLTSITAFCPWVSQTNPCLELVQPRETCPNIAEKLLTWMKELNQTFYKYFFHYWRVLNFRHFFIRDGFWTNSGLCNLLLKQFSFLYIQTLYYD